MIIVKLILESMLMLSFEQSATFWRIGKHAHAVYLTGAMPSTTNPPKITQKICWLCFLKQALPWQRLLCPAQSGECEMFPEAASLQTDAWLQPSHRDLQKSLLEPRAKQHMHGLTLPALRLCDLSSSQPSDIVRVWPRSQPPYLCSQLFFLIPIWSRERRGMKRPRGLLWLEAASDSSSGPRTSSLPVGSLTLNCFSSCVRPVMLGVRMLLT